MHIPDIFNNLKIKQIMDPQQQKKAIIDAPWMKCECGGITFVQLVMVKRISKLFTGSTQDQVIEVPMMKCDSCGKLPGFMTKPFSDIPDDMKATTGISLVD